MCRDCDERIKGRILEHLMRQGIIDLSEITNRFILAGEIGLDPERLEQVLGPVLEDIVHAGS